MQAAATAGRVVGWGGNMNVVTCQEGMHRGKGVGSKRDASNGDNATHTSSLG